MQVRLVVAAIVAALPSIAAAQANPVATAFKNDAKAKAKNLIAAFEDVPVAKYGYKPTPAQRSIGEVAEHLAAGNDFLCGTIGGMKAPTRTKITGADNKDALVARLKETFEFCDQALANLDDSKLGEELPAFGGRKMSRAALMTLTTGDWADHYSQMAIYMRLIGLLPPTAKKPAP